jgi:hypothetical protein
MEKYKGWEFLRYNWGLNWRENWEMGLIGFNLAKIKRNLKFEDDFEMNSQIKRSIKDLFEKKNQN